MMERALGIDLGGTHVRVALLDAHGKVLGQRKHHLRHRDPEAIAKEMSALARELGIEGESLPVTVAVAGWIWKETGMVALAPNLGWKDQPFAQLLGKELHAPVRLVNDLDAITYGEAKVGAGEGSADVVCVFVGTGVGMGALVHGVLLEGADGVATELGHTKIASITDGRKCGCGQRGCLEAYAGGRHLGALLAEKVASGLASPLAEKVVSTPSEIDAADLERGYLAGDAAETAVVTEMAAHLARAIGNVVTILNPRVVVVGGGVFDHAPHLTALIKQQAIDYIPEPHRTSLAIRDSRLGDDAGLVGAGLLALHAAADP